MCACARVCVCVCVFVFAGRNSWAFLLFFFFGKSYCGCRSVHPAWDPEPGCVSVTFLLQDYAMPTWTVRLQTSKLVQDAAVQKDALPHMSSAMRRDSLTGLFSLEKAPERHH